MKKIVLFILIVIFGITLSGCGETISGVGKDISRIGRGIKTIFVRDSVQ